MKSFVISIVSVFALCLSMCWPAHAQKINTWDREGMAGAAAALRNGYSLQIIIYKGNVHSELPYVVVHKTGSVERIEGLPPIAVAIDDGKICVQLADTEWWDNVPLTDVIKAVKQFQKGKKSGPTKAKMTGKSASVDVQSPFQLAAWGRGGCSSCAGGSCQAEAPVPATMPDQGVSVCPSCPAQRQPLITGHLLGSPIRGVEASVRAVEQRRESTIERRFYRGRWVPGLWFRLGRI